jgi:phosphocarrier protein HPr
VTNSASHSKTVKIGNELGIHARPAALIVKTANSFASEIYLEKDGNLVSGRSIIGLLTIEGNPGSKVRITAEGEDAQEALAALEELFRQNFYED